jgi:ABC-type dipeptide/oligopeptide/nickel transport system permease component
MVAMSRTGRYALRRLAILPFAVAVVATLAFAVVNLLPGDPARVIGGDLATPSAIKQIRAQLGLNEPLLTRYRHFLGDLVHGRLGDSYYTKTPITQEIWSHLPSTLELIVLSLLLASIIGLSLGGLGSYFADRLPDRVVRGFVVLAQSIPDFFLGLILIYVVFFRLRLAPSPVGQLGLLDEPPHRVTGAVMIDAAIGGNWSVFASAAKHAILPVVTLGIFFSAFVAKISRSVLGEALASEHVEFARACGLPERTVMRYAAKAARTPIITYIGLLLATLSGGAAIVETVFAWNGVGQWVVQAILRLDIPAIQGFIVVIGLITLIVFMAVDLLVLALDPRVKYTETG